MSTREAARVANQNANQNGNDVTNDTVKPTLRKKKLVKKQGDPSKLKYYLWLGGHVFSIVFGIVTFVWQTLWLKNVYYINSIAYRLALIGASAALLATMSHKFGLKYLPHFPSLLAQLNFQYLVLAVIWCFTFKSIFKIIPLFLISVLQLAEHKKIGAIQKQADFLASIIGFSELFLVVYLLLRTIFFRQTSGYQLAVVLIFLWLRILFDDETANMFAYLVEKLDGKVSTVKNEKVLKIWSKVKAFLDEKRQPGLQH